MKQFPFVTFLQMYQSTDTLLGDRKVLCKLLQVGLSQLVRSDSRNNCCLINNSF
eukprot:GAHX01005614.1.p4 GENE.GAHX01005614.1~~GAHX01005614.1.p4  ORF type:complete len:54 (-),score=3.66 GAHX01005614.1:219-380(-)